MPAKSLPRVKRFQYARLEDRRLLAGDVAVVESGHLYIRGDAADNQFEIVVEDDELRINGLDGTTINGKGSYTIGGATVTESGAIFNGGIRAHLGPGHDDFAVTDAQFEEMSIVFGGTGDDSIEVNDSHFKGRTVFQTYDGNDSITTTRSRFDGEFFAITLSGEDTVTMTDSLHNGNSFVVTGDHEDSVVSVDNQYMGDVNLILPLGGDDSVHVKNPDVMNDLGIFLGHGDDTINAYLMEATVEGTLTIGGQAGSDQAPDMDMSNAIANNVVVHTLEKREVFDGGVGGASLVSGGLISQVNEVTNNGDRMATPIVLNATEAITSIEWTGSYERDVYDTGLPDVADRFVLEIFEGASDGAPDSSSVVQYEIGGANRSDSGERGQVTSGGEVIYEYPIYNYSAAVDYTMEAGKEYWVSIYVVLENDSQAGWWQWGANYDDLVANETVHRITWTPDSETSGDDNWRNGGEGEQTPHYFYGVDLDIRLRT